MAALDFLQLGLGPVWQQLAPQIKFWTTIVLLLMIFMVVILGIFFVLIHRAQIHIFEQKANGIRVRKWRARPITDKNGMVKKYVLMWPKKGSFKAPRETGMTFSLGRNSEQFYLMKYAEGQYAYMNLDLGNKEFMAFPTDDMDFLIGEIRRAEEKYQSQTFMEKYGFTLGVTVLFLIGFIGMYLMYDKSIEIIAKAGEVMSAQPDLMRACIEAAKETIPFQ